VVLFPVRPIDGGLAARLSVERRWIRLFGSLNPPRVYSHPLVRTRAKLRKKDEQLFTNHRPWKRQRVVALSPVGCAPQRVVRCAWKRDLQGIVAAITGHKFPGHEKATLAVWQLTPGTWTYVFTKVDRCVDAWRHRRAASILRQVALVRRDLCIPVRVIRCTCPWVGSVHGRRLVKRALLGLIAKWRAAGRVLPILRGCRFACATFCAAVLH
jgi:hypothetical protein